MTARSLDAVFMAVDSTDDIPGLVSLGAIESIMPRFERRDDVNVSVGSFIRTRSGGMHCSSNTPEEIGQRIQRFFEFQEGRL